MTQPLHAGRSGRRWRRIRWEVLLACPVCHLCGKPIDLTLPPNLPMSPTVDHVIPLDAGGDPYDPANLASAHHGCNASKGARVNAPIDQHLSRPW